MDEEREVMEFPMTDKEIKELEEIEESGQTILSADVAKTLFGFDEEDLSEIDKVLDQVFEETEDEME